MLNITLIEERLALIVEYLLEISLLCEVPRDSFLADKTRVAACESYLRRCLEAVFDVGRHILAKAGHVDLAAEYKGIAKGLGELRIVDSDLSGKLIEMAGYRNRMVHLYHQVTPEELYEICRKDLGDLGRFVEQIRLFVRRASQAGFP